MGFSPDSVTKPDAGGKGKDYSTRWHVNILLLCCLNLITSMAKDKAVHCGKSFFNKSHYAGSMLPRETTSSNSTHRHGGLRQNI